MPKQKTSTATKKKKPAYSLEVSVNNETFKSSADDMGKLLTKFVESDQFPVGPKTVVVLKYSKGTKKGQQTWHVPRARRTLRLISLKPESRELLAGKLVDELA